LARFPDQPVTPAVEENLRLREVAASYVDFADFLLATGREQEAEPVWQKAAENLAARLKSPDADARAWYEYALVRLQLGQNEEYQKACAKMLERFGSSASAENAYWMGVVAPASQIMRPNHGLACGMPDDSLLERWPPARPLALAPSALPSRERMLPP